MEQPKVTAAEVPVRLKHLLPVSPDLNRALHGEKGHERDRLRDPNFAPRRT